VPLAIPGLRKKEFKAGRGMNCGESNRKGESKAGARQISAITTKRREEEPWIPKKNKKKKKEVQGGTGGGGEFNLSPFNSPSTGKTEII